MHTHKHTHSILTAIFPGEPGLGGCPLILLLHLFLDSSSFWYRPKLSTSFLTQSHQVFFGRPLCLIPSTSHVIQRLTQSLSSSRATRPNHLNLLLLIKLTGSNHNHSRSHSCCYCYRHHNDVLPEWQRRRWWLQRLESCTAETTPLPAPGIPSRRSHCSPQCPEHPINTAVEHCHTLVRRK